MATNTTATSQTHNGNGSTATFAISFSFLENTEVDVTVGGVLKTLGTHYNISGSSVTFTSGNIPPSGTANIKFTRDTNISTKKVDFADGSVLTETDLDNNSDQILFAQQEITDKLNGIEDGATGDQTAAEIKALIATSPLDFSHIGTNAIVADKIASNAVTETKIINNAVTQSKIANNAVIVDKIAPDAVNGTKIADNSIDSEHYVDGSIDTAHLADAQITANKLQDGSVTDTKLSTNSVVEAKIVDANVTAAKLASNSVTTAKIADNSVTTAKIGDTAITEAKIANSQVTSAKLASNSVTNDKIADAELTTLAGMQSGTASKLADSTALTSDIADLNQLDGMAKQTTITDDDTKFPTSGAVVDYVSSQLDDIGGFESIANELSFPNTQAPNGVSISIADAAGLVVSGIGQSTTARTLNGTQVTINNIPSNFHSSTVASGVRFIVTSTGSGQIYNYHKATLAESDLVGLSGQINDFSERYRVGSTNPTSNNDAGDLFFNTSTNKLLVYNGTSGAWEEAQSIGNFFISTLSPAFDGSTQNFTITNAPTNAQQILLIIEGVIQKPNSGTSTPTEGFALDSSTVKLAAAPAVGASYHAVVMGSTVNIGVPSNNTVTSAILQNGSVTSAKLANDAVTADKIGSGQVTETKIATNAITQTKIADNAVIVDKLPDNVIVAAKIAADAVNGSKIADDSIDSEHYVDGSIDTAHIADDAVTADKLANSINSAIAANTAKDLTALSASNLTSGTVPDARFPATLPAVSGANLTNLPASGKATNLAMNGAMELSQRGTSSDVSSTAFGCVDRYQLEVAGLDNAITMAQVDVASGETPYTLGFRKALKLTNGNQTSIGNTDTVRILHKIEAQDIASSGWNYKSSSSNITLSFWVKSSVAQSFKVSLISWDGSARTYVFDTGSLTANTWTKVTKTISGNSNVTFDNNNDKGLQISFHQYLGTNYTASSGYIENQWNAYQNPQTPDQTNTWYDTDNATFELTGVLLEVGDSASDFPHESFNETLLKCKRYCHVVAAQGYSPLGIGFQYYSGTIFITYGPIDMRTTPTMVAKALGSGQYVYEKVFSNSPEYIHQISLDSKTKKDHAMFSMSGTASRAGEAVRCAVHAFSLQNNEPFVYLDAELY